MSIETQASQLTESNVSERRVFEFNLKKERSKGSSYPNTSLSDSNSFEYELSSRDSQNSKEETISQYALSFVNSSKSLGNYSIDGLNTNLSLSIENEVFFGNFDKLEKHLDILGGFRK